MNSSTFRPLPILLALGMAFSSVSCFQGFQGFGYWQQPQASYQNNYGYPPATRYQQGGPSEPGGFTQNNTDHAPPSRYGYNGRMNPGYGNPSAGPYQPPTKSTKPKGESASTLHKRETKPKTASTAASSKPKEIPKPTSAPEDVPYGSPVIGQKGFVYSPHAKESGMVDVSGIPTGTKVECPYTKKHFRVP